MYTEGHRGKRSQNSPGEVIIIRKAHALLDIKTHNKAVVIKVYGVGAGTDE